jgi:hypothetical protein
MITITLTRDELLQGAFVGVTRNVTTITGAKAHTYDLSRPCWVDHVEGALGEMAFAKYLNKYWSGAAGRLPEFDVDNKQVRCTQYKTGYLSIFTRDNPAHEYFLITGIAPTYNIVGSIYGYKVMDLGQNHPWFNSEFDRRHQWRVPQSALTALHDRPPWE